MLFYLYLVATDSTELPELGFSLCCYLFRLSAAIGFRRYAILRFMSS